MRHSSLIRILRLLIHQENNKLGLIWDRAEPISLEDIKAKFAVFARSELANSADHLLSDHEALTLEELWRIFESLEELEDYPVI